MRGVPVCRPRRLEYGPRRASHGRNTLEYGRRSSWRAGTHAGSTARVRHVLTILRNGVEPEERDLASSATAGGSLADLVSIAGAPAAALRLEPCAAGVVVEACATGVRAVGTP